MVNGRIGRMASRHSLEETLDMTRLVRSEGEMKVQLQEAKAKFSSLVDRAITKGPVTVTRHGKPVAVLVSAEEWARVNEQAPSFADLLLSFPGTPEDVPRRSKKPLRDVDL
jgi:prevent-host-death family protein